LALPRAPPASTARRAATCSLGVGARVAGVAAAAALLVAAAAPAAGAPSEREVLVFDHDQGLVGADFRGRKDLVGAIFSKSNCKGADFSGADLHNAQLDDAVLIEAKMDGANCENVLATKAKLQKASLRGVNFTNANLISAVFGAGTDVEGAGTLSGLAGKLHCAVLSSLSLWLA
jgi:opacity protein-like surface antigen